MICHQQSPAPINLSCSLASTNSNGNTAQFTTSSQPPSPPPLLVGRLRFRLICIFALAPPVAGILGVLGLALWLHSDLLFGYEWSCGIAYLPSVSRVLNLPAERILWNFMICLHFPLRFLITSHYYLSFRFGTRPHQHQTAGTIESQSKPKSKCSLSAEQYLRTVFLLSGLADHVFLLCLSIVGERENAELHVIFFSGFLFSTFIHFTAHFYLENSIEFPGKGKRFRMLLLALLWLLIPVIVICFSLHELYCTKFSYESFVLGEYLTVATIFGLNSIILYDRHPNCEYFTIRVSVSQSIKRNSMLINHVDDDDDVAAPNANGSTAKTEVEATRSRSFNKINTDPNFNDRGAGLHLDLVQDWLSVLLCENRARVNKADETFRLFTNSNTAQHFFTICLRIRLPQEIKYLALEIYNKFMISHLSGLYAMINAKARTENVKKRDWERVLTTVSRQVTLRTLSCIQVASKLHSNKTSMTVERVQSCLRMLGYAYTDESIRSSEVRVLNSCGWCENQLQTPLTYLESFLSVICQINRPHHKLDTQAIWEYALLVMDCVYLNLEEVYRRVARAAHGRQGTLASKPRLLRVEADYALLASGVIVTACICVHGTDFVATVIFSLQKTTGIPRESISDFYTGIYQSVKNYSVMHPLYAWTNPNPCDDSLQNGSSISSRFGTPLKQQKTVSFRNGFSRKLL